MRQVLNSPRFVDAAPATVWAGLLDEGQYLCGLSIMYRILREHGEVRERRRQATHPARVKPELVAEGPNRCWSWDITKLLGPVKWTYYHLYVIIDIFSRYVPGWLIAERESAALAEKLLAETIAKQRIAGDQLTVHADRGTSMASKPVALLLADLGVTKTHSRPHCSNDNPCLVAARPGLGRSSPGPVWITAAAQRRLVPSGEDGGGSTIRVRRARVPRCGSARLCPIGRSIPCRPRSCRFGRPR